MGKLEILDNASDLVAVEMLRSLETEKPELTLRLLGNLVRNVRR